MDFYKTERHSSAPQIFKESILSNRTGKAEQLSGHGDISLRICMGVCDTALSTQCVKYGMTPLVGAMGRAGLFLTGLNLSPTRAKWGFAFTGNVYARFREKFSLEKQRVDSQSTSCPLVCMGTSARALQGTPQNIHGSTRSSAEGRAPQRHIQRIKGESLLWIIFSWNLTLSFEYRGILEAKMQ